VGEIWSRSCGSSWWENWLLGSALGVRRATATATAKLNTGILRFAQDDGYIAGIAASYRLDIVGRYMTPMMIQISVFGSG
jgi:hypothetical protein